MNNLVIVESPTKARTLARFLGKETEETFQQKCRQGKRFSGQEKSLVSATSAQVASEKTSPGCRTFAAAFNSISSILGTGGDFGRRRVETTRHGSART